MGEGIAGLPPISCHTMIKRSVERHAGSTAIVDRHRDKHRPKNVSYIDF